MVVTRWRGPMQKIVKQLSALLTGVSFAEGDTFCWSPDTRVIRFKPQLDTPTGTWSLLHEAGHAVLNHNDYNSDIELILLEVAAWEQAKQLAQKLGLSIDEDHVQDCIDTYRDWLHQRSTCPRCGLVSLQMSSQQYH